MMTRLALSLLLLLLCNTSFALQVLDASNGETVVAKISQQEMSRIAIDKGRLKELPFTDGELIVEKDEVNGQVFIKPALPGTKPINVWAVDDQGHTYGLMLQPTDIPAESIIIRDRSAHHAEKSSIERSGSYQRVIKNMILAMATGDVPNGIELREMRREIPIWEEARLTLRALYIGHSIVGEKYQLTNVSEKPMVISEPELSRHGVIAVSVENMNLAPGDSSNVFIVREKKDNE